MTLGWVAGRPSFLPEGFLLAHRGDASQVRHGTGEAENNFISNISSRTDGFNIHINGGKKTRTYNMGKHSYMHECSECMGKAFGTTQRLN